MRKFLATSLLVILPAVAFALDYTDISGRYADAPFSTSETAGISVLTSIGAVEGNPDPSSPPGASFTFAPNRTLNRAEFLKIAFLSSPDVAINQSDAENCFPDVSANQWFSQYVCLGKRRDVVKGYPDGFFRPGNPVNYVEALKMLEELFGYAPSAAHSAGEPWYMPYVEDARKRGLLLPIGLGYGDSLTRGQMARLAAAFVAYSNGDLHNYRRAERGLPPVSSSSSSSSVSSAPPAASSISSSSVSSSSPAPRSSTESSAAGSVPLSHDFPARSRFLVAGERSQPIASATFFANLEAMFVRRAEVRLKNEITGIDAMYVVAADGTELGQIALDKIFDPDKKTWRGALTGNYRIPKSEQRVIGIEVRMKARNQGGTSEEMVQVDKLTLTVEGEWSTETSTPGTDAGPYPKHQTSMGRVTSVRNAQEVTGILPLGPSQQLASFTIMGSAVENVDLKVEHFEFQVNKSTFVNVSNWQLMIPDSDERHSCSFNSTTSIVSCGSLPDSLGTLSTLQHSRTFRLLGDVTLASGAIEKNLQVSLNVAGSTETTGAVRWTDQSGHFGWVEVEEPLAGGTSWK